MTCAVPMIETVVVVEVIGVYQYFVEENGEDVMPAVEKLALMI